VTGAGGARLVVRRAESVSACSCAWAPSRSVLAVEGGVGSGVGEGKEPGRRCVFGGEGFVGETWIVTCELGETLLVIGVVGSGVESFAFAMMSLGTIESSGEVISCMGGGSSCWSCGSSAVVSSVMVDCVVGGVIICAVGGGGVAAGT
jgi:hypothetical protein